ncbi:hypothetical protein [Nocardioides sp. REDSEA-S30_B4]|jgi:hypothetical protein|uniref:hypothetical protein n=1 Tax=Nocardioides sp. REDSEA-S30_B4 TaxID=1811552 RepID=UPI000AFF9337|nr:hypothetical protein [Nocardioides sp. REDSEA-S30_B4]
MSLDNDTATRAISAYFGSCVFSEEPTWCSVLLDEVTDAFDSPDDLHTALDLMNLRVEVPATSA